VHALSLSSPDVAFEGSIRSFARQTVTGTLQGGQQGDSASDNTTMMFNQTRLMPEDVVPSSVSARDVDQCSSAEVVPVVN
jgi:hypothetical protein